MSSKQVKAVICTGVVLYPGKTGLDRYQYAKYRNISNRQFFIRFAQMKFPKMRFINWYIRNGKHWVYNSTQKFSL